MFKDPKAPDALAEMWRLRNPEDGSKPLSYRDIARKYGCAKETARRNVLAYEKANSVARPLGSEEKFTKALAAGKTSDEAAKIAGVPDKDVLAYIKQMAAACDKVNMGAIETARKLKDLTECTKLAPGGILVPDNAVQVKATEVIAKIHLAREERETGAPVANMKVVVLTQKDADMFKVFRGDGTLPETFEIAPEGVAEEVAGEVVEVKAEEVEEVEEAELEPVG